MQKILAPAVGKVNVFSSRTVAISLKRDVLNFTNKEQCMSVEQLVEFENVVLAGLEANVVEVML